MNLRLNIYIIFLFFFFVVINCGNAQERYSHWTDSVYNHMSIEERVAQILISSGDLSYNRKKEIVLPGFYFGDADYSKNNSGSSFTFSLSEIEELENKLLFNDILNYINSTLYYKYKSVILKNDNDGVLIPLSIYNKLYKSSQIRSTPRYAVVLNNPSKKDNHLFVYDFPDKIIDLKSVQKEANQNNYLLNRNIITDYNEATVQRILAPGVLLYSENYRKDLQQLTKSFAKGILPEGQLEAACKYVLQIKYENRNKVEVNYFERDRNLLIENLIGFFQLPDKKSVPITDLAVNISFFDERGVKVNSFFESVNKYYNSRKERDAFCYNIYLFDENSSVDKEAYFEILSSSSNKEANILLWAGDFDKFPLNNPFLSFDAVIAAPVSSDFIWNRMGQALFSGLSIENKLTTEKYPDFLRVFSQELLQTRLKYGLADEVGVCADTLKGIDDIVNKAIEDKATPGAQVFVVKDGVVVYDKSFGSFSYSDKTKIDEKSIYDLASITKIAATMPMLISLYDEGKWRFNNELADYFQLEDSCDKKDITIRELLMHESGLNSFIPFYQMLFDTTKINGTLFSRRKTLKYSIQVDKRLYINNSIAYNKEFLSKNRSDGFSVQIADNMFLRNDFQDSIISKVFNSNLNRKSYLYSDLNFILLEKIASKIADCSIDRYLDSLFYTPLGANSLTFNPLISFDKSEIAPTEVDNFFRFQEVRGYVHDQGAAMMGGVAGHAGLFGNANDLAKLLQMYLNNGVYGGKRYLNSETVKFFTSKQNDKNRRGLGFDKPEMADRNSGPTGIFVSESSYGHTGFTGTIAWVDPEYNLIYIFLSNRISPNSYNNKLLDSNVRTEIQDVIYRSILQKTP